MKPMIPAVAVTMVLGGCMMAMDGDRLGAQLAASDARLAGCASAAGITGPYRVWTEVLGHGPGATVVREVRPSDTVTAAQAAQMTRCLNA